jgi:hypothetical protein
MQQASAQYQAAERATPTETHRLRTVDGNRWPPDCRCNQKIPREPEIRDVVEFGAPKPYPASTLGDFIQRDRSPSLTLCGVPGANRNLLTFARVRSTPSWWATAIR